MGVILFASKSMEGENYYSQKPQNSPNSPNPVPKTGMPRWIKYTIRFLAGILVLIGLFVAWSLVNNIRFNSQMASDPYGGKTPEETLNLFINALETGDLESASQQFVKMPEDNFWSYLWLTLSHKKPLRVLKELEAKGKLPELLADLKSVEPAGPSFYEDENDYRFFGRDEAGKLDFIVDMYFNQPTGLWKIQGI